MVRRSASITGATSVTVPMMVTRAAFSACYRCCVT